LPTFPKFLVVAADDREGVTDFAVDNTDFVSEKPFAVCKDAGMKLSLLGTGRLWTLTCGLALTAGSGGCLAPYLQSTVGGQTLPSAYYLDDDVQYFPRGPEMKLANQIRALERYKLERQAQLEGVPDAFEQ
jgi:hypothetical protein